jgi:hypothetical protein
MYQPAGWRRQGTCNQIDKIASLFYLNQYPEFDHWFKHATTLKFLERIYYLFEFHKTLILSVALRAEEDVWFTW